MSAAPSVSPAAGRALRGARRRSGSQQARLVKLVGVPAVFVVVVVVWEALVHLFDVPPVILPPPSAISGALVRGFQSGLFVQSLWITTVETVLGFLIGAVTGIVLGGIIAQLPVLEVLAYPYIVAFQAVPKMAIAPLLVIWLGFGIESKVAVAAMVAFFPILVNTIEGLKAADRQRIDMLRSFDASEWQIFRMVKVPSALPFVFAGLDVGAVLAVLGAVVAEFVGAKAGLGNLVLVLNSYMDISGMFAVLVILSLMGVGAHLLVHAVQRRLVFWSRPPTPTGG